MMWAVAGVVFVAAFLVVPILLWVLRTFGFYTVVHERTCKVYVLFGKASVLHFLRHPLAVRFTQIGSPSTKKLKSIPWSSTPSIFK